ncbi:MAG: long-chain fatty acid--CoA ligase [Deltaproteobacteria bacterium]|nr:long-chain fatty acid--CoA ligase [Deltaproteobacteria bacterium]
MEKNQNRTLPVIFLEQVNKKKEKAFLLKKDGQKWRSVSWQEAGEIVKRITMGLMALGVKNGDRVSAISNTRPDLAYCCIAIANAGAIFTGIYHTNSPRECAHVINDSGAKIVFAENREQCEKIIEASQHTQPLEKIIVFDDFETGTNPMIMSLDRLCEMGEEKLSGYGDQLYMERILSVKPDDISAIIYTSGTTGPPKGVIDTHEGVIRGVIEYDRYFPLDDNDRGISFLPMAHALELREGHWNHVIHGFTQVYAESVLTLFEDVRDTEPTYIFTPPRFFEKHYKNIWAAVEKGPAWKKKMAQWCLEQGAFYQDAIDNPSEIRLNPLDRIKYFIANQYFLKRVRKIVGEKLKFAGAGGAPISPELLQFFRSCNIPIYEGYGQTETMGMVCVNRPGANKVGTVGKPLEDIKVKIAEDGEILVDGWIKTTGYWNNPEGTKEILQNGWLYTGDMGVMDKDGFVRITGRKKEILITSTGKNISPSYIENIIKMSSFISQAVVCGEGKTYLSALLTLTQEEIIKYANDNNISFSGFSDLTKKQEIINLIQGEVDKANKELAQIENIKKFTILEMEFSQARGEVTPTLKIKRNNVIGMYKEKIEAMY